MPGGVNEHIRQLIPEDEEQTGFYPWHLEDFISTLRQIHPVDRTRELEERYLGQDLM